MLVDVVLNRSVARMLVLFFSFLEKKISNLDKTLNFFIISIVTISILRIILISNLPINFFASAGHDDGWFMLKAFSITNGEWFGTFDHMSLIKGPGYPLFLALVSISGFPISIAHALFHFLVISYFCMVVFKTTRSKFLTLTLLFAISFLSVGFSGGLQRIIREQIYWAQIILIFSLLLHILKNISENKKYLNISILLGVVFGWTWLTREEGILLLPGFLIITVSAYFLKLNRMKLLIHCTFVCLFYLFIIFCFRTINFVQYNSFIGVDFVNKDFNDAVNSLQRIDSGPTIDYLPIPTSSILIAASVSPTFKPVAKNLIRGGALFGWEANSCKALPNTCGNIAGGWFLWALRDSMALEGRYANPSIEAFTYKSIALEIDQACGSGIIKCKSKPLLDLMPPLNYGYEKRFLEKFILAVKYLFYFEDFGAGGGAPQVINDDFNRYWPFLNYPIVDSSVPDITRISGWFIDFNSLQWPKFILVDENNKNIDLLVEKNDSPDLANFFRDERFIKNRFSFDYTCYNNCELNLVFPNGTKQVVKIETGFTEFLDGSMKITVDSVQSRGILPKKYNGIFLQVREVVHYFNKIIIPVISIIGVLSFLLCLLFQKFFKDRLLLYFVVGLWTVVVVRIVAIVLIDITSFPAVNNLYLSPAYYISLIASVFSIYLLFCYLTKLFLTKGDVNREF